jgi:pimeloyl-ACP methyl ester carboxylesterase
LQPVRLPQKDLRAMPYRTVNGANLYYESYGEGQPIVFVHGSGGNHASWFHQIDAFSNGFRVIVYDQRGFGNSEDVDGRGRAAMVADLGGLLDHLEIARAVLVAQSLGGGTCTGYTVRHPGRVAGLALCDTLTGIRLPPDVGAIMAEVSKRTAGLSQAIRVLGPQTRERFPEKAILYTQLASFNTYRFGATPGAFDPVDPAMLAATGVPILYVVGSDDILYPPDCIRRVQSLVPNSQFVEIAGVGHSAYFEDAATFNRHLRAFVAKLPIG